MYSGKLTESNGLRTAVKLGELTPAEAIDKLGKLEAEGHYVREEAYAWLVNYQRRNK